MAKNWPFLYTMATIQLVFSCSTGEAATFYVDNSGSPECSNSPRHGSDSKPWCTINYGISRIAGGDTLYVKNGTYREDVYISSPSGTADAPTSISTYPGQTVTILGPGVNSGRVKITHTSHMTIAGFEITNFNQGLFIDNSHHVTVQHNNVHHVGQEGIGIHLNSSFITVQHNTVHDTRQWQYNGEGIYVGQGSTASKDNSHHITVKNNTIYNVADEAIEIKPGTHDCRVEGNTIYHTLLNPSYSGPGAGAIEINQSVNGNQTWNEDPRHIVRNNVIHDTKMGIRAGTGVTVYNNVIYDITPNYPGILADNVNGDSYIRKIYHNTVDLPSERAILVKAGSADVANNIGPSTAGNMATADTYYVDKRAADYHLAAGSAPIDAGTDLTGIVPADAEGRSRSSSPAPDLGAYECDETTGETRS